MMRTSIRARWARIRVLFTLVVAISILSTLIYLLSGGGLFRAKSTLRTYFEDSGGMEKGAVVTLQGVVIGKVSDVRLSHLNDPARQVEVELKIDRRFLPDIPEDSKSEITTENALGDKFIQINHGQSPAAISEGAELGHKPATNVYVRIDITTFTAQLRTIDAVLKDIQEGKGDLGQFVMTDDLYRSLLNGVSEVEKEIKAAVGSQSSVGSLVYSEDLHRDLIAGFRRLNASLVEIEAGRGAAGKLVRDPAAYDGLRKQAAEIRRQIQSIRDTEFMKSDALYVGWNRQVVSLIRAVDDFNAGGMMVSTQLYESFNGSSRELGATLKDFRLNPRKFLRLKIF